MRDLLTREQAVAIVGEQLVDKIERMNCEPDGLPENGIQEWTACTQDDIGNVITCHYYLPEDISNSFLDCATVDWVVAGYTVTEA